jgi:uncharacterized repeat protein (TIGR01451 family)
MNLLRRRIFRALPSSIAIASLAFTFGKAAAQDSTAAQPHRPVGNIVATIGDPAAEDGGRYATSVLESDLVRLSRKIPDSVALGETVVSEIEVTALQPVSNLVVTDTLPASAGYSKSEPEAQRQDNQLTWRFDALDKGQKVTLKLYLTPTAEGTITPTATFSASPRNQVSMRVGHPSLTAAITGPDVIKLNENQPFTVNVVNTGTVDSKAVVLSIQATDGLAFPSGSAQLRVEAGRLGPQENKQITVMARGSQRGKGRLDLAVTSSNTPEAVAGLSVNVAQAKLKLAQTGPADHYIGKSADYAILVGNSGDLVLTNVTITVKLPSGLQLVSAPDATTKGGLPVWTLPSLAPGQDQLLRYTLNSHEASSYMLRAEAAAPEGNVTAVASTSSLWRGIPSLVYEVSKSNDPIQIGDKTTYTVRITNQGTGADTNVSVVAAFPKELTVLDAKGPVSSGLVSGEGVRFPPIATLRPRESLTFTVTARGEIAGDARIRFTLTTDDLSSPIVREENTRIY